MIKVCQVVWLVPALSCSTAAVDECMLVPVFMVYCGHLQCVYAADFFGTSMPPFLVLTSEKACSPQSIFWAVLLLDCVLVTAAEFLVPSHVLALLLVLMHKNLVLVHNGCCWHSWCRLNTQQ